jgi:hypothetical protein
MSSPEDEFNEFEDFDDDKLWNYFPPKTARHPEQKPIPRSSDQENNAASRNQTPKFEQLPWTRSREGDAALQNVTPESRRAPWKRSKGHKPFVGDVAIVELRNKALAPDRLSEPAAPPSGKRHRTALWLTGVPMMMAIGIAGYELGPGPLPQRSPNQFDQSGLLPKQSMDLTTLITACALTVDPKIMHALIWHQSGGEPWAFSISGQRQPQVLRSMEDAVGAARTQPDNAAIRVGLTGLPGTPRSVSATMFTPCSNIAAAARQIAQFGELCRTSSRSKGDPIYCAIAAYRGSWERPDNGFAEVVRATVAKDDAPDFEMPEGRGIDTADSGSLRRSAAHETMPAPPPPTTTDDFERARQSPLFPVKSRPSEQSPSDHPVGGGPAGGEQKTDGLTVRLTATPPLADGLFVARSARRSAPKSE